MNDSLTREYLTYVLTIQFLCSIMSLCSCTTLLFQYLLMNDVLQLL